MKEEKLNFGIILRIGLSLLPILFGMPFAAMLWCSFNIAMSFIVYGPMTSLVSSLCSVCISMFFFGIYGEGAKVYGLYLAIEAILCAGACVYTVAKRRDFYSGVWLAAAGYLVPGVISIKSQAAKEGLNIAHFLTDEPIQLVRMQFEQINQQAGLNLETEFIGQVMEMMHSAAIAIVPSLLVISSVVVGYIIMWCVCARLRNMPGSVQHSFSKIKIPRTMIILMAVALTVYFININSAVSAVMLNIFVIMMYLCCFAGLSLVDYFLRKPVKVVPFRVLIYFGTFMFMSTFLIMIFVLSGIVDSFFDFRKIKKEAVL